MDSARETMMHQNFQSFDTLWERSSEDLMKNNDDIEDSNSMARGGLHNEISQTMVWDY